MAEVGYHDALMRRLGMIQGLGANATALQQMQAPQGDVLGETLANMPQPNTQRGGGGFGGFMNAISSQESGGNYGARNKDSGAMGKYQIMPANLGGSRSGWDFEALGRDVSVAQFMKSPQIQEAVAQFKLKQYYDRYGPAGAAVAWYAGPGTVSSYLKNPSRYTNPQGAYPSIANYVRSILSKIG